jgi:hypothetical protein
MRGTGSVDFRVTDLFIPEEHSYSMFEPAKRDGTLWRRATTFIPKFSGVPLGCVAGDNRPGHRNDAEQG